MKNKTEKLKGMFALCCFALLGYSGAGLAADDCQPDGELNYICGLQNSEDILPLGKTDWLLSSGMDGQFSNTQITGHIYLVNRLEKTAEVFFPGASTAYNQDKVMFAGCPGPVNPEKFSSHGLALREQSSGIYRLYMTSHGEREAIEVFDIDARGKKPAITWVGCVLLPEKTWANSVVILADGGFVATNFMDPTVPNIFAEILQGKISGFVYEWHPGDAVAVVEGTELSAPNGIALSADERWMYVNAFGTREVVRYDRTANPITKQSIAVPVAPDNIRWGDDGMLYIVGMNYVAPADCASPPCSTGWSVFSIDPDTLAAKRVAGADQTVALQGASAAVLAGKEIWIGTYNGTRIGYLLKQ
ncbi:MAG: SGL protein [Gammaproteobacteria bacterium]|nr:SGL protein [Gammaproteobacteria bacterium]